MASGSAVLEEAYIPPPEFQEDAKDPLVDLSLTDSTELWLIQWPKNKVRIIFFSQIILFISLSHVIFGCKDSRKTSYCKFFKQSVEVILLGSNSYFLFIENKLKTYMHY